MKCSIIIRTYNEEKHLGKVLDAIQSQSFKGEVEIIIVDSGSTDHTLRIANNYNCEVIRIKKENFSFGRSLNYGCNAATGDLLTFISAHCIPTNIFWLSELVKPFSNENIVLSYGCQVGIETSKFSEKQLLKKYFPTTDSIPQEGFFCNNANSSIRRDKWLIRNFDEELTGLEDMAWAKYWVLQGHQVAYVASSTVFHIHDESWQQVQRRYEREAFALKDIMPEVQVSVLDMLRYIAVAIYLDSVAAFKEKRFFTYVKQICYFRFNQYLGTHKGNHLHRKLSKGKKEQYYYPS
jgi:glycosyltransferase involved in cell wall biosynthesis